MQGSEATQAETPHFLLEVANEVRSFFATVRAFALHPIAAPRAWADGRLPAMNPVAFCGAAIGVEAAALAIARRFVPAICAPPGPALPVTPDVRWFLELLQGQTPFLLMLIFAGLLHAQLRALGSTQVFRATLGVVLFIAGLEGVVGTIALPILAALHALGVHATVKSVTFLGVVEVGFAIVGAAAVHRLPTWRKAFWPVVSSAVVTGLAILALVIASAFAFGYPRQPREDAAAQVASRKG